MADDLDQMLQGADDQTPASPANQGGQDETVTPLNQQPEEVEFNSLSGNAQDRVRELVKRAKDAEFERDSLRNTQTYVPSAPLSPQNPEIQQAVQKLSEFGIATDDKVNETINLRLNQIRWDQEMGRLSSEYSGNDNSPKFVREEVEDYIRSHTQFMGYAPEDVFKYKMFPDEFTGVQTAQKRTPSLKPTKPVTGQPGAMSVEYIAERTDINKYPDAREWQEEHRAEIDKVLGTMQ